MGVICQTLVLESIIMHDALHQQRFTQQLNQFSERHDDLFLNVRGYEPQHIPLEVLDETAIIVGELTLLLSDHLAVHHHPSTGSQSNFSCRRIAPRGAFRRIVSRTIDSRYRRIK